MGKATLQETFGPLPIDIPVTDLVSFAFDQQKDYDRTKPLYFDAADPSLNLSAVQVERNVKQLIAGMKEAGVKKGDTIVLHLFNSYVYTCLWLATLGTGAAFTGSNPSYTVWELGHRFKLCDPAMIITAPEHLEAVQAALKEAGQTQTKIFTLDAEAYKALSVPFEEPSAPVTSQTTNGKVAVSEVQGQQASTGTTISIQTAGINITIQVGEKTDIKVDDKQTGKTETTTISTQNGKVEIPNGTTNEIVEKDGAASVAKLMTYGSSDWYRITDMKEAKETLACCFSTSGTTGLPKVSQISHYGILAQNPAIRSENKDYQVRALMSLPFFNLFASGLVHLDPLRHGDPMYVMQKFSVGGYINAIEKYQITDTATAPLMLIYMLKSGLPLKEKLASLRFIWNGSAPVDAETLVAFQNVLSEKAMIGAIWGMSETGCQTAFKWFEQDVSGSVGRIVPGVEMKLLDENGNQIFEDNVTGEAYVRSPQLMNSYAKNQEATDEMIQGEWLRTGDVCYVSDGKWFVVDRKKELIKVRGWQVAPAELEGVLKSNPKILDAAVVGVPYGDSEAPRGFILRAPGITEAELTEQDVRSFMSEKLAKFKDLNGGIVFVDEIPKNMTGKTVKKKLTDKYPYVKVV